MWKICSLSFLLFLQNVIISGFSYAENSSNFGLTYVGGKSMNSSPATTGTTSVPPTRYSTPTIRSVPQTRYATPSISMQHWEIMERQRQKRERKRANRERNESLLRMLGILP
ncbi:MAG: hypothetical protein Q8L85_06440 [Alphaproteobacteria bacterium]|nr:hypothetical protein [Alphaproteobacteria bacterium]